MGLWQRLFGDRKDGISNSLDLFRLVYGGQPSKSGVSVTPQTALEVTTVLACCRVISEGISQVPFKVFQDDGKTKTPAVDHPLYRLLYRRPNDWQTSFEFRETVVFHMLLCGNAYVFVNRVGVARRIAELVPIDPGRVTAKQMPDMSIQYSVRAADGSTQVFGAEAIWHLRGPSWNSWLGLDPVRMARDAIGLTVSLQDGQAQFQKNGAQSSGVLAVSDKLSPDRFNLLAAWLDKHLPGGERFGKPLIADSGATYTPTSLSAVDQQLLESRKLQIEEICRIFRVMPIMVGAVATPTYASAEQLFLAHVVHTLSPWYERIEHSADVNLLSEADIEAGYYTKFNANALMRGAATDRANYFSKALGAGGSPAWMTQDEVRDLEELNPMGGEAALLAKPTVNATTPPPAGGN